MLSRSWLAFAERLYKDCRAPLPALLAAMVPLFRVFGPDLPPWAAWTRGTEKAPPEWAASLAEGMLDSSAQDAQEDSLQLLTREALQALAELFVEALGESCPARLRARNPVPALGDPAKTPVVLVVAGSDSGGGAGIQADIKSLEAAGAFSCTALTALTAQNTKGVSGVFAASPGFVKEQAEAVTTDFRVGAVKTGMLPDVETVDVVARLVSEFRIAHVVVDPVLVSTSGDRLVSEEALAKVRDALFPVASLVTPNLPEAAALLGLSEAEVRADRLEAARRLGALGPRFVLLKGGHAEGAMAEDLLLDTASGAAETLSAPWVDTECTHGTGCTLASHIAGHLARGWPMKQAVQAGKDYVTACLLRSSRGPSRLGSGRQQPMQHSDSAGWCWL